MNEEQLKQLLIIIDNLASKVEAQETMLKACMDRIDENDRMLKEEIIEPIYSAYDKAKDEKLYGDFSQKFGDRLSGYNKILSAEDGVDTDVTRKAYDTYNNYTDEQKAEMSEEEYVDALVTKLDEHIANIRESLGLSADTDVSIESTENGKLEIAVDGEPIASATEETMADAEDKAIESVEETPTGDVTESETTTEEEEPTSEDESVAFYNELVRDREKYMGRR